MGEFVDNTLFPPVGESFNNLILWRASTDTYHYLTPESYDQVFNSEWDYPSGTIGPPPNGMFPTLSVWYQPELNLEFGPAISEEPEQTETTLDYDLHSGANLISIPLILTDSSLDAVFGNDATGVIGEGVAASNTGTQWVGSLQNID